MSAEFDGLTDADLAAAMAGAFEAGDTEYGELLAAEQADRLTADGARLDALVAEQADAGPPAERRPHTDTAPTAQEN
ncbi:hypothetical protein ACTWJ8_39845 (plasmid) [Streptomyces sp. SDT5-1]|uniref:hypothetical protein n=1 Tax=Streptomyces sp. SDT5-1 TaxID=3406418 RepID=UPI003FD25E72